MTAGVAIRGPMKPGYEKVLTPEAIGFAVELEREFGAERRRLLARRAAAKPWRVSKDACCRYSSLFSLF